MANPPKQDISNWIMMKLIITNRRTLLSSLPLVALFSSMIFMWLTVGVLAAVANTPQGQITPTVTAGWGHTVGLKDDGTAFAVGDNRYGQCNIGGWTDITQIAAGGSHTVGLKSDGTVVAVGFKKN